MFGAKFWTNLLGSAATAYGALYAQSGSARTAGVGAGLATLANLLALFQRPPVSSEPKN